MKLGLIARMDNTGLGNLTWEHYNHLKPFKTMVIDFTVNRNLRGFKERYADDCMFIAGAPSPKEVDEFLDDLDIVLTVETPYTYYLLDRAKQRGIPVILQPMVEFAPWLVNPKLPRPTIFGAVSPWRYDEIPDPKLMLPIPIALERFNLNASSTARKFLHIAGRPAANDRNGTRDFIDSLEFITSNIVVTITCQKPLYVEEMLRGRRLPSNLRIIVDHQDPENYWDLYEGQDVLVLPRRYAGLSLPVNEALGAGMPVIMPDISPNNQWLPKEWLVPAVKNFDFTATRGGLSIEVYKTDPKLIAAKIDQFAKDNVFYGVARKDVIELSQEYSWSHLQKLYFDTFETVIKNS